MDLALAIALPAACMMAGHWFPWRRMIGQSMPRPLAYAYGVGVILAVTTLLIWIERPGAIGALGYLWAVALSAGAATLVAYAIDAAVEASHLKRDLRERMGHDVDAR